MRPTLLWRIVALNVMMTVEYRGDFFILMLSSVGGPLVSLLVWLAVSDEGVPLPYDRSQFVTYYVLLSVVSMLTNSWLAHYVAEEIRLGTLSPWLLRPAPFIANDVGNNVGEKIIKLPLLLPLVLVVALAFREDLRLPTDIWAWSLFVVSLPMASTVAFLLDFVTGSLAFWVQDVHGLVRLKDLVSTLLNGRFLPLALFPPALSGAMTVQPFRYTLSFPLEVLSGRLSGTDLAFGFGVQVVYCVTLWACYRILWRYGLRSYAATGA